MKLTSILQLSFLALLVLPNSATAQHCPTGNPSATSYIVRTKQDRCEGTRAQPVSGGLSFAGLYIGQLQDSPNLSLLVPRISGQREPEVSVNSLIKNYQMKPVKLTPTANRYAFNWSRAVLNRASIPLASLHAKAVVNQNPTIYLPVILGQDRQYTFVLYSSEPIALALV